MRSVKHVLVVAAFAVLLAPVVAHANGAQQGGPAMIPAPQYRITSKYARSLVSQKATQQVGRFGRGWTVTFHSPANAPIGGSTVGFKARVNWGSGPHIMTAGSGQVGTMIAVPEVSGTINMQKAPGAPKGLDRVQILSPGAQQ